MAGKNRPDFRVNPALRDAVRSSGKPGWRLALAAQITHHSKFSALINSTSVAPTRLNYDRLCRIADLVGFDRSRLLLRDGEDRR